MHPAFSVIFFTVTAGAGYGLLVLLSLVRITGVSNTVSPDQITAMGFVGLVLVSAGLISSTFHLANPKNAWRSFTRFKTSWLSREAVFAVLFYPISLIWLICEFFTGNSSATQFFALLNAVLAIVVLICTAMIYASLKTIRQWHNALTPVNFVLLGLLLGALILAVMFAQQGLEVGRLLGVALIILVVAALVKITYFFWIGQPAFGFQVDRVKLIWLRVISVTLAFVLPLLLLAGIFGAIGFGTLGLAALSAYAGVFVERWLFFAEARHVVNLYHGSQRT